MINVRIKEHCNGISESPKVKSVQMTTNQRLDDMEDMFKFYGWLIGKHRHGENFEFTLDDIDKLAEYAIVYTKTGKLNIKLKCGRIISLAKTSNEYYVDYQPEWDNWNADRSNQGKERQEAKQERRRKMGKSAHKLCLIP